MKLLFVSSKVQNRIAALKKCGKASGNLAQKANNIIDNLASGAVRNHTDTVESYTKYGEKRIRNCRKYDLGCGYRLITVQRDETVFIPFLGSHDECQRWLENNSRLKEFHAGKGDIIHIEDKNTAPTNTMEVRKMDGDADVDGFVQSLTDKDLRTVFKGLIEGAGKGSSGHPHKAGQV